VRITKRQLKKMLIEMINVKPTHDSVFIAGDETYPQPPDPTRTFDPGIKAMFGDDYENDETLIQSDHLNASLTGEDSNEDIVQHYEAYSSPEMSAARNALPYMYKALEDAWVERYESKSRADSDNPVDLSSINKISKSIYALSKLFPKEERVSISKKRKAQKKSAQQKFYGVSI